MTDPPPRIATISPSALQSIRAEVTTSSNDLETGGILLGYAAISQNDIHIVVAGGPGQNAIHEPRRFLRDREHARAVADTAWSTHQAVWIGEWHTHPTAGLFPSDTDLRSYLHHLADPELRFEEFLSLIVASTNAGPTAAAWIVSPKAVIAARLDVKDTGDW